MDSDIKRLPPGDPKIVKSVMSHLKSQGIFDEFRRDCIADVDTKPAYQNLRHRVESFANEFLQNTQWRPDLNKNQQREMLRRKINESGMLTTGVDRIIDQIVNQKIYQIFLPKITDIVHQFLGIEKGRNDNSIKTETVTAADASRQQSADNSFNADEDVSSYSAWHQERPDGTSSSEKKKPAVATTVVADRPAGDDDDDTSSDIMMRISRVLQECTTTAVAAKGQGNFASIAKDTSSPTTVSQDSEEQNSNKSMSSLSSASSARVSESATKDDKFKQSAISKSKLSSDSTKDLLPGKSPDKKPFKFEPHATRASSGSSSPKKTSRVDAVFTKSPGSVSPKRKFEQLVIQSSPGSSSPKGPSKTEAHGPKSLDSPKFPSKYEPHATRSSGSCSPKVAAKITSGSSSPKVASKLSSDSSPRIFSKPETNTLKSFGSVSPRSKTDLKSSVKKDSRQPSKTVSGDLKSNDQSVKTTKPLTVKVPAKTTATTREMTSPDSSSSDSASSSSNSSETSSSRSSARLKETGNIKPAKFRDESFVLEPDACWRRGDSSAKSKTSDKGHTSVVGESSRDRSKSDTTPPKRSKLASTSSDGIPSKGSSKAELRFSSFKTNESITTVKPKRPISKPTKYEQSKKSRSSRDSSKPRSGNTSDSRSSEADTSHSKTTSRDASSKEARRLPLPDAATPKPPKPISPKRSPSREKEFTSSTHVCDQKVSRKRSHQASPNESSESTPLKQSKTFESPRPRLNSPPSHFTIGSSAGSSDVPKRSSEKSPHKRGARRRSSESSPARVGIDERHMPDDDLDDGEMSDVTVSSVHTSDLSDFDDRIVLSDGEADDAEEPRPGPISPPPSPFAYTNSEVVAATTETMRKTIKVEPAANAEDVNEGGASSATVKLELAEREQKTKQSGSKENSGCSHGTFTHASIKEETRELNITDPATEKHPSEDRYSSGHRETAKKSPRQQSALPPPPVQDPSEPRRGSQRQRKLNPRYTSDDFTSIFNSSDNWERLPPPPSQQMAGDAGGAAATSPAFADDAVAAALPAPPGDMMAPVRGRRLTGHSNTTDETDLPPGSPISDASEFSVDTASRGGRRVSARSKLWSPVESSDGDHSSVRGAHTPGSVTPEAHEGHDFRPRTSSQHSGGSGFGQKRDRSRSSGGDSSLVSPIDETAHCSTRTDSGQLDVPTTHSRRASSSARRNDTQRYDSSDLYKPRPSFSSSRRRPLSPGKPSEPSPSTSRDDDAAASSFGKPRARSTGASRHLDNYPAAAAEPSRWSRKLYGVTPKSPSPRSRSQRSSTDSLNHPLASMGPSIDRNLSQLRRKSIKLVY